VKKRKFLGEKIPPTLFANWKGYSLYIIRIYLRGQLTLTLPAFLGAMIFIQIITRVVWYDLVGVVAIVVGFVTLMAYVFYHYYSPNIRAFLSAMIAGEPPKPERATRAWMEAINFPQLVVSRTMAVAVLAYTAQAIYFFLFTEFELALVLQGWVVTLTSTVAIALVFFLFYLERRMYPVSRLAMAAGAQVTLNDPLIRKFRLRVKLLVSGSLREIGRAHV